MTMHGVTVTYSAFLFPSVFAFVTLVPQKKKHKKKITKINHTLEPFFPRVHFLKWFWIECPCSDGDGFGEISIFQGEDDPQWSKRKGSPLKSY